MRIPLVRQGRVVVLALALIAAGCSFKKVAPVPVDEIPKYVQIKAAGFFMREGRQTIETVYVVTLSTIKQSDKKVFIDLFFQNPQDRFHPILMSKTVKLNQPELSFTSPQVRDVRADRDYLVDVYVYDSFGRAELLSHLQQNVRAVMDETTFRTLKNRKPQK